MLETVWAFVGMSKIEFNPRKRKHLEYLEHRIFELHTEIFNRSMKIVMRDLDKEMTEVEKIDDILDRKELKNKLHCIKKYNRRLKLIQL